MVIVFDGPKLPLGSFSFLSLSDKIFFRVRGPLTLNDDLLLKAMIRFPSLDLGLSSKVSSYFPMAALSFLVGMRLFFLLLLV